MRIPESELIINGDGSIFHLHIHPENLADTVILVGDPGRVAMVKSFFSSIEAEGNSREFFWATGLYNGKRITVLSTGIGTDNIDIVMTELDALANIDFQTREVRPEHRSLNILRIGTCGAIQPEIPLGAFILSHISVGCDGLLNWYANRDRIALPDFEAAFKAHVHWNEHLPDPYFVRAGEEMIRRFEDCTVKGMTVSASGFYGPQGRVVRQNLAMPDMLEDFESFEFGGYKITNFEMEGSALAGMSAQLGHNAATVCCAIAHRYLKDANTDYKPRVAELVKLALEKLTE
ncbi:MAG: nucleoside phosphorylase [Bacteroidales bacterium]|nr:nucleoside phosphorylase [Bacteroidales bacterium]